MNFTSRSRYALKIMMDLAHFRALPLVRRAEIAKRQGIPPDYLDQIMIRLRTGKLVESVRGRGGGYRLARAPEEISIWDVFGCVEDNIYPVECVTPNHACGFEESCVSKDAWTEIFESIQKPLQKITLSGLVERWGDEQRMCPIGGLRECRSGSPSSLNKQQKEMV